MSGRKNEVLVQCTTCERVYAGYYTPEGDLMTPAGKYCPNCSSEHIREVQNTDI